MNKKKIDKILLAVLFFVGTVDVYLPESYFDDSKVQLCSGGKMSVLKACAKCAGRSEKIISNPKVDKTLVKLARTNRVLATTEILGKGLEEAKASDEILPKIGEYLSQTKASENSPKVIQCIRTDADNVRMCLYEDNMLKIDRLIKGGTKVANLAEYDVYAMQESFFKGEDGIEYVSFIIPRKSQYILNSQFEGRIYESMIFNVPKDVNGNWKRFKEYLKALLNDILNRPIQLWDEMQFRRGLAELNINSRDVVEIEKYSFAQIIRNKKNENIQFVQQQIA